MQARLIDAPLPAVPPHPSLQPGAATPATAERTTVSAAARDIPGHQGMWVGICLEFIEFTVFFFVYFVARWHQPQAFRAGAPQLWTTAGVLITGVMLTSGYLLVRAVLALRAAHVRAARGWMLAGVLVALGYPLMKWLEFRWNLAHGVIAGQGAFFTVYYYLTINHLIHSSWGILGMFWVLARLWFTAQPHAALKGLESLAIYWHATDIVWLMLFTLFYAFV